MSLFVLLVSLAMATVLQPLQQDRNQERDIRMDELRAIEQRLAAAWVSGDRDYIKNILADDWTVIDAAGRVLDKRQVMQETFESKERQIDSLSIDDVHVRTFEAGAVVTGRTRARGRYQGTTMSVTLRFTDVFVRRGNKWQIIASHASMVVQ